MYKDAKWNIQEVTNMKTFITTKSFSYKGHKFYIDFFLDTHNNIIESWLYADYFGVKTYIVGTYIKYLKEGIDAYITSHSHYVVEDGLCDFYLENDN